MKPVKFGICKVGELVYQLEGYLWKTGRREMLPTDLISNGVRSWWL